ncbi:MAG TPA: ABC transporter ATP-binding protein [Candidatus Dormibacteraeota bacterium]|nr:ABC transporter ATP-binding protein [Candidatus Dormibacteraeota bacterium]
MGQLLARLRASAEWRFLGVLWSAAPALAALWWGLLALRGALPAGFALAMGVTVGAVQGGRPLTLPLAATGVLFVAMSALGPVHDAVGANLGARASTWLHERLLDACLSPPGIAHLERPDLADQLSMARDFDLGIAGPPLTRSMSSIGSGFADLAGGGAQAILLTAYAWWAGLAVGGAWLATHVLLRDSAVWKVWQDRSVVAEQRHVDYAYRMAVDAPAAKEVRLFGLGDWVVERFTTRRLRMVDALFEARRLRLGPVRWGLLGVIAANAAVFGSLAHDILAGHLALGALVVFAQAAVGTSALGFGEVDWWFRQSAQPIPGVLDLAGRMRSAGALRPGSDAAAGLPGRAVEFRDVRFAYPGSWRPVLDGFSLTIPAGSSLAIVGQNGAGKTTLAKLLCRLYDPEVGAVLVDGTDLRDLDLDAWRRRMAAVFQDYVRYELTLRDNVAPAGAPDADVLAALEQARAGGLAGLSTVLSRAYDGGTDLSGGQWQRVALARALCAVRLGAGVVILDEPTAQLDVRGEAEVFDRILEATRGCTTILVSHRFSTVRHADRICVLEAGRVVELGSHDELMALGGRYRTMFDLQAARFVEEGVDALGA